MNWKKIKSLFVVENEDGKKKAPAPAPNKDKKAKATPKAKEKGNSIVRVSDKEPITPAPKAPTTTPKAEEGQVKQQFVDHLLQALETNNLEGIDYFEFKNTLQSFAKMPMDDNLRYQSALTAVKTMGASEQKIIQSANHYLGVLAQEEASFKKAVERGRKQKIDGEIQRIEELKKMRAERLEAIEKMKVDVEKLTKEINVVSEKVMEDQVKIDTKSNHFYASYEFVANQIKSDLKQLKQFTQQAPKKDNTQE